MTIAPAHSAIARHDGTVSTVPSARPQPVPRLVPGTELLGPDRASGLREAPCLVRRPDGEIVRLAPLLFLVAQHADGTHDAEAIALELAAAIGRPVSPGNVVHLVETKLRPLGVLLAADGTAPPTRRIEPLLGLRFRFPLVPAPVVRRIAGVLRHLHRPAVVATALLALLVADGWLLGVHGVQGQLAHVIDRPALLLALFAATITSMFVHELGHASACRYAGGRPSAIGAGVYLVWPVLYSDVTESYRFDRAGRLRTDLGGVYFNGLIIVATVAAYALTGFAPLVVFAAAQNIMVLNQFMPWVRLDGYYVVSDLIGVPDLFAHIGPTLRRLVPGRGHDPRTAALRPGARAAVTVWVVVAVTGMAGLFTWIGLHAHVTFARAVGSLSRQGHLVDRALAGHDLAGALLGLLGSLMLVLSPLGLALTFCLLCRRLGFALGVRAGRASAGARAR